mgnify:CR=1 FL=1
MIFLRKLWSSQPLSSTWVPVQKKYRCMQYTSHTYCHIVYTYQAGIGCMHCTVLVCCGKISIPLPVFYYILYCQAGILWKHWHTKKTSSIISWFHFHTLQCAPPSKGSRATGWPKSLLILFHAPILLLWCDTLFCWQSVDTKCLFKIRWLRKRQYYLSFEYLTTIFENQTEN